MTAEPLDLEFGFLADHSEWLEQVVHWWFGEWGVHDPNGSYESWLARTRDQVGRDGLPLHLLAISNSRLVGTASLKQHELRVHYPHVRHWLGHVYVPPEARGRHIGSALALRVSELAEQMGVTSLHLHTPRLDGGLYSRLGWIALEEREVGGQRVLIMSKPLGDPMSSHPPRVTHKS